MAVLRARVPVGALCAALVVSGLLTGCQSGTGDNAPRGSAGVVALPVPAPVKRVDGAGYADYRMDGGRRLLTAQGTADGDLIVPSSADVANLPPLTSGTAPGRIVPGKITGGGAIALRDVRGADRGVLLVVDGGLLALVDADGDKIADLVHYVSGDRSKVVLRVRRSSASVGAVNGYLAGEPNWCHGVGPAPSQPPAAVLLACPSAFAAKDAPKPSVIVGVGLRKARPAPPQPSGPPPSPASSMRTAVFVPAQDAGGSDVPDFEYDARRGGPAIDIRRCTDRATLSGNLTAIVDYAIPAVEAFRNWLEDDQRRRDSYDSVFPATIALLAVLGGATAGAIAAAGVAIITRSEAELQQYLVDANRALADANRDVSEARAALGVDITPATKRRAIERIDHAYSALSRALYDYEYLDEEPVAFGNKFWHEDCPYTHNGARALYGRSQFSGTVDAAMVNGSWIGVVPDQLKYRSPCPDNNAAAMADPNIRCVAEGIAAPRVVDAGLLVYTRRAGQFHAVGGIALLAPQELQGHLVLAWSNGGTPPLEWPMTEADRTALSSLD